MQKPETLEDLLKRGQEMSSIDEPLAAWNGQQSTRAAERFHVIFNGKVYFNTEWVDSGQCPGDTNPEINPWKFERDATKEELKRLGNPTGFGHLHDHYHPLKH